MDYENLYAVLFVRHRGDAPSEAGRFDTFGLAMSCALRTLDNLKWPNTRPDVVVTGDMKILSFSIEQDEPNPPWVQIRAL